MGIGFAESAGALAGHNTVFSDDIVNGQVKSVDIADGSVTSGDIKDGTIGSADLGALSPRWAVVDPDSTGAGATVLRNRGGSGGAGRFSPGVYWVECASNVDLCSWTATLVDNSDGVLAAKLITVEPIPGNPTSLIIRAFDTSGSAVDLNAGDLFAVQVDC